MLESGTLNCTRGTWVKRFESNFSERYGVPFTRCVTSGTAAIHTAVAAIDPEPGDEIITTSITDMGALTPILYQSAIPIFADVDPYTYNVTAETIAPRITERTRAIIVTPLFGNPCDMGLSSAIVALEARFGALESGRAEPAASLRGAMQLAAVAAASLVACLANPYGIAVLELVLRVSESSAYITESIWEWRSPLVTGPGKPWFAPYLLFLAALWVGVMARIRQRPWLDAALALVVTVQSLRANRFVPYVALIGFPIAVRGWLVLTSHWFEAWGPRKRLAAGSVCIAFMLATSFGPASILSPRARRPMGWGYGGPMPYREVKVIRDAGYRGVIYNEYADGALIIYSLHPAVRPVMDARIDVYGEELYLEYQQSRTSLAAFDDYLEKYAVDLVMLDRRAKNQPFTRALQRDPGWKQVLGSKRRVLFSKSREREKPRGGV